MSECSVSCLKFIVHLHALEVIFFFSFFSVCC